MCSCATRKTAKITRMTKIPVPRLGTTNQNTQRWGKPSNFQRYTLFVPIPANFYSHKRMTLRKNFKWLPTKTPSEW